jgi:hypothetical protein
MWCKVSEDILECLKEVDSGLSFPDSDSDWLNLSKMRDQSGDDTVASRLCWKYLYIGALTGMLIMVVMCVFPFTVCSLYVLHIVECSRATKSV